MSWSLFIIDPRKYKVVETSTRAIPGVIDCLYKLVDSNKKTKSGKKSKQKIPVFPGYFFVEVSDLHKEFVHDTMLKNPNIKRYVGQLTAEEAKEISKIKADDKYSKKFTESFSEGDRVVILEGLFKDYEATIISVKQTEIVIETDLKGKPVRYSAKPNEISMVQRS